MNNEEKFGSWQYNVIDEFKPLSQEEIQAKCKERSLPFGVLLMHLEKDFNVGSIIRSANFLGAREIYYYGARKLDRRGSVCAYKYSPPIHLSNFNEVLSLKEKYSFIGLENNLGFKPIDIRNYDFNTKRQPMLVIGEESKGLSEEMLSHCESVIEIVGRGSIRSLNAASAFTLACHDMISKRFSHA